MTTVIKKFEKSKMAIFEISRNNPLSNITRWDNPFNDFIKVKYFVLWKINLFKLIFIDQLGCVKDNIKPTAWFLCFVHLRTV